MSIHAERVAAPPARTARPRQPSRPAPPPRPSLSHVLQLRAAQARTEAAAAPSRGDLPADLKAGVEQLSGIAMDDVRVHRNSPEPARLGAFAYTRSSEIHLGPGQDRHLAHEAWHVVQQKQGRAKPTLQMKGLAVDDSPALELEADAMGARAAAHAASDSFDPATAAMLGRSRETGAGPIQLKAVPPKKTDKITKPVAAGSVPAPDADSPRMQRYTTSLVDRSLKTRTAAMASLAEVYGEIGKDFQAKAMPYLTRKSLYGAIRGAKRDSPLFIVYGEDEPKELVLDNHLCNDDIKLIDPLVLEAEGVYEKAQNATDSLTITIRYANNAEGYVTAVKDTALAVDDVMTSAREPYGTEEDVGREGEKARGQVLKGSYSTHHHKAKGKDDADPLADVLTKAAAQNRTLEAVERGVDAICKFIAESGRFQAAKKLGGGLSDKSLFYTQVGNKDEYKAISFQGLYLSWMSLFGKKYDIEDGVLIAVLNDPPKSKKVKLGNELVAMDDADRHIRTFKKADAAPLFHAGAAHYDLDTHAAVQGSPPPRLVPAPVVVPAPVAVPAQPAPPQAQS